MLYFNVSLLQCNYAFKGVLHFFLEIGSFYHSPRVKQLSFTIFKCVQTMF